MSVETMTMTVENSETSSRGRAFRDPVHQMLRVEHEFLRELIDTPEFQRLRRVRQLGVSWLTYHGAEHSRFSHSMGVLHLAGRILETLKRRYAREDSIMALIEGREKTVLAAALLHDIGHAPFSHMMERAFEANSDHEKRTRELIVRPAGEIARILQEAGIPVEDVRDLIMKVTQPRFLCDIVSSQLDADRMDYLLRDSHFTGVGYGRFDLEWLVNNLCLGLEPVAGSTDGEPPLRLCLEEKRGLHAAEQLIIARYHMTVQVYFHRVTRMWEAHLLCLFRLASRLAKEGALPEETDPVFHDFLKNDGQSSHEDFLVLDDHVVSAALQIWARCGEGRLRQLAEDFLHRKKCFQFHDLSGMLPVKIGISSEKISRLDPGMESHCFDDVTNFKAYKDWVGLFSKSPEKRNHGTEAILLSGGLLSQEAIPVETKSFLFASLGQHGLPRHWLFVHNEFAEQAKNELSKLS